MKFLDRQLEMERLNADEGRPEGAMVVLYGRRRIGKTRLLLEWCKHRGGLYTVADQSSPKVQRRYLAEAVSRMFSGFADVEYPDWRSFFRGISDRAVQQGWTGPLVVDELPYLVLADKTLPAVLQAWLDHQAKEAALTVAFAGSSQHMMQGLALDASSPLFGRASQIIRLGPIPPLYGREVLGWRDARDAIRFYSVFGGIPRYWELAAPYGHRLDEAVDGLVLDPLAPLHNEPDRLLAMETPSAVVLRPILDVVGQGAHRLSEIGGRTGQAATSLSKPMSRLIELDLVAREIPFGDSERNAKRSLYKLNDPFLRFWFRTVAPKRAYLAQGGKEARKQLWKNAAPFHFSDGFEDLCRRAVPGLHPKTSLVSENGPFGPAGRFWQAGSPEWDVVALSLDKKKLLLGEVKWSETDFSPAEVEAVVNDLVRKGVPGGTRWAALDVVHAVFVPGLTAAAKKRRYNAHVIDGTDVIDGIR